MPRPFGGVSLLALTAALASSPAMAQAATASRTEAPEISEVIVTAEKRAERLQDVPISITAVSTQDIQRRGVTNLMEMQYAVPGLTITQFATGQERIELRGVSNYNGVSTVGRYFNEMPINVDLQASGPDVRLIDMERIEVLNGPQPTLYGQGSMGGAVRFITAAPDLTRIGANVEGEVGSVSSGGVDSSANGMVNLPLIDDRLAVRLVGGYERDGGWVDNTFLHKKDVNRGTIATIRGSLLFRPTDRDEISIVVQHEDQKQEAQNHGINGLSALHVPTHANSNYEIATGVYKHEFGSAEFVASGGYLDFEQEYLNDLSGYFGPLLKSFGYPTVFNTIGYPLYNNVTIYTGEARLASTGTGPLSWLVGVDYRRSSTHYGNSTYTTPNSIALTILAGRGAITHESWSEFGQLGYQFTPKLSGSIGLRYYADRETFSSSSTSFSVTKLNNPSPAHFHSLNPKLTIQYKFSPEAMVYTSAAKGFRAGGFNPSATSGNLSYKPDQLWTYEVGTKEVLFDHKLDVQADVYYNKWTDVQSLFFLPGSAVTNVENAGDVAGWGVDFAANLHPVDGLTLSGTYGWNNLEYKKTTASHRVGDPVDTAVRESFSASIDYRRPIAEKAVGFVRLDYQHAGRSQITLRNFAGQIVHIAPKERLNARVGVQFAQYELSVFGTNLTDDRSPIVKAPYGVLQEDVEQQPLTVGVNVKAHF
jgi:iron complex outermembrane receptor protein